MKDKIFQLCVVMGLFSVVLSCLRYVLLHHVWGLLIALSGAIGFCNLANECFLPMAAKAFFDSTYEPRALLRSGLIMLAALTLIPTSAYLVIAVHVDGLLLNLLMLWGYAFVVFLTLRYAVQAFHYLKFEIMEMLKNGMRKHFGFEW